MKKLISVLLLNILTITPIYAQEEEQEFGARTRKNCFEDLRKCTRKIVDNYDDGAGSNQQACNRWKTVCSTYYDDVFKALEETTEYTVIKKNDLEEMKQKLEEVKAQEIQNKSTVQKEQAQKQITQQTKPIQPIDDTININFGF